MSMNINKYKIYIIIYSFTCILKHKCKCIYRPSSRLAPQKSHTMPSSTACPLQMNYPHLGNGDMMMGYVSSWKSTEDKPHHCRFPPRKKTLL